MKKNLGHLVGFVAWKKSTVRYFPIYFQADHPADLPHWIMILTDRLSNLHTVSHTTPSNFYQLVWTYIQCISRNMMSHCYQRSLGQSDTIFFLSISSDTNLKSVLHLGARGEAVISPNPLSKGGIYFFYNWLFLTVAELCNVCYSIRETIWQQNHH